MTTSTVASPRTEMRGLTVTQEDGHSCPLAYCDGCGHLINDVNKAGVLWRYPAKKNGRSRFSVLCKFRPDGSLGCLSEPHHRLQPWQELSTFLMSLLYNSGVKTGEQLLGLWERADVAARFE